MNTVRFEGRYQLVSKGNPITAQNNESDIRAAREQIERKDGGLAQVYTTDAGVFVTTGKDSEAFEDRKIEGLGYLTSLSFSHFHDKFMEGIRNSAAMSISWTGSTEWAGYKATPEWQDTVNRFKKNMISFFDNAEKVELPSPPKKLMRFLAKFLP